MQIAVSTFYKKNDLLGDAALEMPGGAFEGWTLNGVALVPAVAEYIVKYGLRQTLADSIASAKTLAEAEGLYAKRRNALLQNTIGVRESGGVKRDDDPIAALAIKNAKAALMARFEKLVPDAKRMADYCKHDKIAPYFKIDKLDANKATWVDAHVMAWIDGQKDKHDYMAEAAKTLAIGDEMDI